MGKGENAAVMLGNKQLKLPLLKLEFKRKTTFFFFLSFYFTIIAL